jgi:hypothetical protein
MPPQDFAKTYTDLYTTATRLLQYLREIRASRWLEGDATSELRKVETDISQALADLQAQKYQAAAISVQRVGKSTFLNAVIGEDILATDTESCTVCRTDIRHIPVGQVPRLLEYRQGQQQPVVIVEGDAQKIRQKFLEYTREIRQKNNPYRTLRFELEHPIEVASTIPFLAGFTLVDTPGSNEWKSANFDTTPLKQASLEALRNSDVILFILDYNNYKTNEVAELFRELGSNRKNFLLESQHKVYFILNKVDMKEEHSRKIEDVIRELKQTLMNDFHFPDPIIYPASAKQGLLAKLILKGIATESHHKEFRKIIGHTYSKVDAYGGSYTPPLSEIAPSALIDSSISNIEETAIKSILLNSGYNLIVKVLLILDLKVEDTQKILINQSIIRKNYIHSQQAKITEWMEKIEFISNQYKQLRDILQSHKEALFDALNQQIDSFCASAKSSIKAEIEKMEREKGSRWYTSYYNPDWYSSYIAPTTRNYINGARVFLEASSSRAKMLEIAQEAESLIYSSCNSVYKNQISFLQRQLDLEATNARKKILAFWPIRIEQLSQIFSIYIGSKLELKLEDKYDMGIDYFQLTRVEITIKEYDYIQEGCIGDGEWVDFYYRGHEMDFHKILSQFNRQINQHREQMQQILYGSLEKYFLQFIEVLEQINDCHGVFQVKLNNLWNELQQKEAENKLIIESFESHRNKLNDYRRELAAIRGYINTGKP